MTLPDPAATAPASLDSAAAAELAHGGPAVLQPLRNRDFRLLFSGETISLLGDQFHFVALSWLVLQLTGSGIALGTVLMTAAIPRAIFMLVGGALSDRLSPRTLMIASNAIRGVLVGGLAALVIGGRAELWHVYLLAGAFGLVDAFFYPAMNTIVPMLVPARHLAPANALVQGMQQLSGLVGPAIAGLLIAAVQTGPAFAVNAASFGVAAVALWLIVGGRRTPATAGSGAAATPSVLGTIRAGLRYAWQDPAIRGLVTLTAAFNLAFAGPIAVGLPWIADQRFDGGAAALGFLLSAFGAGALVGAVVAGSVPPLPRLGSVLLGLATLLGLGLIGIGLAPSVPVAIAVIVPMGLIVGFINVRIIAWLQRRTPDAMRGRVMGIVMLGSVGLTPISLAAAGVIIEVGAAVALYTVAGGIVVGAVVAGLAWGLAALIAEEPEGAADDP